MTRKSRAARLAARMAWAMMPASERASEPVASFVVGNAEEDHAAQAQFDGLGDFVGEHVGRELVIARHGGDLLSYAFARPDEERQDQIGRRKAGFLDQFAHGRIITQASKPSGGEGRNRSWLYAPKVRY